VFFLPVLLHCNYTILYVFLKGIPMSIRVKVQQTAGWLLGAKVAGLCKVSYVVGSYALCFAGGAVVAPVAGAFIGTMGSLALLVGRTALHYLVYGSLSLKFLSLCVPGFFAGMYWSQRSALFRCGLPLACMALFVAHPVGGAAAAYTVYWLVPVAIYCIGMRSVFAHSLASTFIAHAVGSTLWLYTVPMTASMWLGLIPVVAAERLLFASAMTLVHAAATYGMRVTAPTSSVAAVQRV